MCDACFLARWIIFFWHAHFNVAVVHCSFQALFTIILWFPLWMWGVQRNQSKLAVVCLDFASVLLVEPSPVAPLPSFFFKARLGGQWFMNCISKGFWPWAFEILGIMSVKFHSRVWGCRTQFKTNNCGQQLFSASALACEVYCGKIKLEAGVFVNVKREKHSRSCTWQFF